MFAMDTDQPMSDLSVKSWMGIYLHTGLLPFCVTLSTPNNVLANFVQMYFLSAFADFQDPHKTYSLYEPLKRKLKHIPFLIVYY